MKIVPALLTDDVGEFDRLLEEVAKSGRFDRVQVDFVDGEYADNKSVTPLRLRSRLRWRLRFDAHLMVVEKNLAWYVKGIEKLGFDRIIAQMESISHPENFSALALDVHSPVEAIKPYLPKLEYVVVMAIEPGFGGQKFIDRAVDHVRDLKKYNVRICVDGGVEKEHLPVLEEAGADEVAVGVRRVLSWGV